jgi:hypothetical protein
MLKGVDEAGDDGKDEAKDENEDAVNLFRPAP